MLKKLMAKVGLGSAKVDLVLHKREYSLGEILEGEFRIQGGTVEQKTNQLGVDLLLQLNIKGKPYAHTIASIPVASTSIIQANEKKTIPFTYSLPTNLPISNGGIAYCFVTRLDIAAGVDHLDKDYIQIIPPVRFQNLIRALEKLEMREQMDSGKFNGYAQKFSFFPTRQFRDQIKEIEFEAAITDEGIRLLLEIDLPTLPFGFGEKELKQEVYFSNKELDDVQFLAEQFQNKITEMLHNPQAYPASQYARHYQHIHLGRPYGSALAGAMGGFAAGILGGILLEELLGGDELPDFAGGEEEAPDEGGFGDFFGEDEEL